jgi:glycosyltransferase involved in cell wall biosynthesis
MGRKIVIIGSAWPLRGGLSAFNERIARQYASIGDEVEIYTFSLQYPAILFPGKTQYSSEPAPNDLKINVKINTVNPVTWFKTGNEIKNKKPDLVIIKFWIPFVAPSLGKIARIIRKNGHSKVISIIDNIIPHEKRPGDKQLASYWVNSVDGFVTMSKAVLGELDLFDKEKPKMFCPHPLYDHYGTITDKSTAKKKLGLEHEYKYMLFFGFIRDYKGLDILLQAMDHEYIKSNKIKLLVAGEFYTDSKPYFELIEKHGLGDVVIMSNDFIPDSKVALYFNACDVVVQPYKDATQSGVTQIAYHFEKPIITTNVGGLAEIVPDNEVGFVTEPDVNEIQDAIIRFYRGNKGDMFEKNVRKIKFKYSWDNMLAAIDSVAEMTQKKQNYDNTK